jgi:phosphoribosylformylglycinamidine cyclo-ligase
MMRTFNNGLGLVIIVNEKDAAEIVSRLNGMGETAHIIGSVQSREKNEEAVQFEG